MEKKRPYRKFNFGRKLCCNESVEKEYMEKKRPSRKFNFGVNNNVVMSMLKKRIGKRKDHIENLILALKIML